MEEKEKSSRGSGEQKNSSGDKEGKTADRDIVKMKKALRLQKFLIGALACVVVAGAVAVVGYQKNWFGLKNSDPGTAAGADIDPNAGDWDGSIPQAPKGNPDAENIAVPGYPEIYLPAGQTEVDVAFANPEGNPCYFTFQLVLKENDEVLYESKQVPPGEAITKATLSRTLDAGSYEAVLKITTASIKDLSPMNGANMETTLKVE